MKYSLILGYTITSIIVLSSACVRVFCRGMGFLFFNHSTIKWLFEWIYRIIISVEDCITGISLRYTLEGATEARCTFFFLIVRSLDLFTQFLYLTPSYPASPQAQYARWIAYRIIFDTNQIRVTRNANGIRRPS